MTNNKQEPPGFRMTNRCCVVCKHFENIYLGDSVYPAPKCLKHRVLLETLSADKSPGFINYIVCDDFEVSE